MELTKKQKYFLNVAGRIIVGGCTGWYFGRMTNLLCKTICKNPISQFAVGVGQAAVCLGVGNQIDKFFDEMLELCDEDDDWISEEEIPEV